MGDELIVRYKAEVGLSKGSRHSILFYRRTDDRSKCLAFQWKRSPTDGDGDAYECLGCVRMRKKEGIKFTIGTIRVNVNRLSFNTNPEALAHKCVGNSSYEYDCTGTLIQQILRLVLINFLFLFRKTVADVKERKLKPTAAKKMLQHKIETIFPTTSVEAMNQLPKKQANQRTFQRSRKIGQNDVIDPYNIPPKLYVSICVFDIFLDFNRCF